MRSPIEASQRQLKVSEHVRHALSEFFNRKELQDSILDNVIISITEVRMTPDLKLATCFFSAIGSNNLEALETFLNNRAKFIRGRVTPALKQMKYMPKFRFLIDKSFENFAKINSLLQNDISNRDINNNDES
ncbi:30S ribosome-binding factor RbfA [Bartonella sp. DGB1]|uniref:30S ribosome-binding factor RbfA n=1 Tax=Bartonella sp. DGB1 TaxID=3239807 RepID=UPI003523F877